MPLFTSPSQEAPEDSELFDDDVRAEALQFALALNAQSAAAGCGSGSANDVVADAETFYQFLTVESANN